ncbi:hypothetical protein GALMADRAFT_230548 [Galerina marginata CBS 339.88]|uniref:Uncharacterized protein n=1 Tax=Galerina marginata (strain CBS 339.88) TaxID=685588 RepID=A0A067SHR3_GALM3|nr:hypothetical protein GALMADRAFT_230548 [Galerina marginata CBS 339.88]
MSNTVAEAVSPLLLGVFRDFQVVNFARVASNSIILYDYRFFASGITLSVSQHYTRWEGWTGLAASMLAQAILQLRIYALYRRNKRILALMLTFYIVLSAVSAWIMWNYLALTVVSMISFFGRGSCIGSDETSHLYPFYIPLLLFDGLLCVLAIVKGLEATKSTGSLFHRGQSLIEIFVQDSIFYFMIIGIIYLVCTLCIRFEPPALVGASVGFAPALSSVFASRVIFNLREAGLETKDVYYSQPIRFR